MRTVLHQALLSAGRRSELWCPGTSGAAAINHWDVLQHTLTRNGTWCNAPPTLCRTLDAYSALMQHCWAEKSADRPTFPEILSELGTFRSAHALPAQTLSPVYAAGRAWHCQSAVD